MAKFIGEYCVKIDDKGRLVFPSAFKAAFAAGESLCFVVKRDLFENCLCMYTVQEWEKESEGVKSRLNFFNKEHAKFWREYMRERALVEPDEKLGRISLPKKMLSGIHAEKEIVFAGNDHKIEIWSKEAYEAKRMNEEEFTSLAEKILG